jgi:hypothetical protein
MEEGDTSPLDVDLDGLPLPIFRALLFLAASCAASRGADAPCSAAPGDCAAHRLPAAPSSPPADPSGASSFSLEASHASVTKCGSRAPAAPVAFSSPSRLAQYNEVVGLLAPDARHQAMFALAGDGDRRAVWHGRVVKPELYPMLLAWEDRQRAARAAGRAGAAEPPPCPECCTFIFALGNDEAMARVRALVCRHDVRGRGAPPRPDTPDGYWDQREDDVPGSSAEG